MNSFVVRSVFAYNLGMSSPWVVTCKGCDCVVNCFAIDPQAEHMRAEDLPPHPSSLVTCSCCWKTYRNSGEQIARGTPAQNPACGRRRGTVQKAESALLVAASIVAAVRLRGQDIVPSPKLSATIKDSVHLARLVLAELERRPA